LFSRHHADKVNWPLWSELANSSSGRTKIIYGDLSGTATASFLAEHGIQPDATNSVRIGPESRDVYAFHVPPTTVFLDKKGNVQAVWLGLLTKERLKEIDQAIG
jgi:hypothetical protein